MEQIVNLSGPFFARKWVQIGLGIHIECLGLVGAYATVQWRSVLECLGQARAYATVLWSIASPAHHLTCLGLVETSLCLCVLCDISRVERRIATFFLINSALVGAVHISQLAMLLLASDYSDENPQPYTLRGRDMGINPCCRADLYIELFRQMCHATVFR